MDGTTDSTGEKQPKNVVKLVGYFRGRNYVGFEWGFSFGLLFDFVKPWRTRTRQVTENHESEKGVPTTFVPTTFSVSLFSMVSQNRIRNSTETPTQIPSSFYL